MCLHYQPGRDIETPVLIYPPLVIDGPQDRYSNYHLPLFIRKVYLIVCLQVLLTIAVVAMFFVSMNPLSALVWRITSNGGLTFHLLVTLVALMSLGFLCYFNKRRLTIYFMLGLLTSILVGLSCLVTDAKGNVMLQSLILTVVVVVSLSLYTYSAAKRGLDFEVLGPYLFCAIIILVVFAIVQVFFAFGRMYVIVYGCSALMIFFGYIVYDTGRLIKRWSVDHDDHACDRDRDRDLDCTWAAVSLYLHIINLFLWLLTILRATTPTK